MSNVPSSRPKTVLVVDDSELSRAMIARIFKNAGYRVLTAEDGAQGAVVAHRELPDVVVTDLEMPVMDGYQLSRLLKSDPATSHLSLVILTSHGEAASRFWGLETGADVFLVKDELEERLLKAVEPLVAASRPEPAVAAGALEDPLDVLARVSRHLDARLLEAVVVNRVLERGMRAETFEDAGRAILETVGEIADTRLLGVVVVDDEAVGIVLELTPEVDRESAEELAHGVVARLEPPPETERQVTIVGGSGDGRAVEASSLVDLELPLRGARARLLVVPKVAGFADSREHLLLARICPQLSLVLDNARLAERLRVLSMRDGLTRLLNRRTFHQRLAEEIRRARRYRHPLSLMLADLDHFKSINDTFGHQAGDQVLVAIAEALERDARAEDVVGRYGGEEFVVLLPETNLAAARRAAQRLCANISQLLITLPNGRQLTVTSSFGVASLAEAGAQRGDVDSIADALLALADQRLYQAKSEGRNQVVP